jgi:glutaredoxin-like YruB-family protein
MSKNVLVYSTPTCPWCIRTKQFLKDSNVAFQEFDVSTNQAAAEEMIKKSGQMGVPVLDIEGVIIIGFDRGKIKESLGI